MTETPSRKPKTPASGIRSIGAERLGPAEAALYETFVVPRYVTHFGDLALSLVAESDEAQVAHLDCRTGYPSSGLGMKLPGMHLFGCDSSEATIAIARLKAAARPNLVCEYRVAAGYPTPLPDGCFSHALCIAPNLLLAQRLRLLSEQRRLLGVYGQAILALALRGSFQELFDLLREYALKAELPLLTEAVDTIDAYRPSPSELKLELEKAGFGYVEVTSHSLTLNFQGGRDFFEDPTTRLLLLPELFAQCPHLELEAPLAYVHDAIDKYWSDHNFELSVEVGSASGRKLPTIA